MPPVLAPMPGSTPIQRPSRLERITRPQWRKVSLTPSITVLTLDARLAAHERAAFEIELHHLGMANTPIMATANETPSSRKMLPKV